MAQEDFGRFSELAALQAAALVLDVAELIESFLELAGEARAVQAKRGERGIRVGGWGLGRAARLRGMGCG